MRDAALLGARLLLGGYMGIHASQKLWGKFNGPGLDGIGPVFEAHGLVPGREMATAAAATELTGGALTITGVAFPAGPLAVAGAMAVAAAHNRKGGLMATTSGVELPVVGFVAGGLAAGALIAKMVTSKPAPAVVAAEAPAADA
jgi:putative oxidoreductase